ncbi:hypothetical protein [Hyphomonas sp.]|uniref:hypothetical protein n=1 Tax=Hyphomonas sp. TaxID=87 RepID=UPI0026158DE8|nr:hypothetical protein [Hyphomonas sp.]MDF1807796.1 hypothetical protein [Hyphomonas sp.]
MEFQTSLLRRTWPGAGIGEHFATHGRDRFKRGIGEMCVALGGPDIVVACDAANGLGLPPENWIAFG